MRVSIIGKGAMGTAIADVARAGGHEVDLLGRGEAPEGDVVVLAVPYPAVEGILTELRDRLAGKVVVDITNPVDFETFDGLAVPADSSAAAQIAAAVPGARVVKAFNTTFASTLSTRRVGDATTTVLVAGDDAEAKETVASIARDGGLEVVDAGSMKRVRELESIGFLQITLAAAEKIAWTGGFALVR